LKSHRFRYIVLCADKAPVVGALARDGKVLLLANKAATPPEPSASTYRLMKYFRARSPPSLMKLRTALSAQKKRPPERRKKLPFGGALDPRQR
jgi:hypothetical protein